MQYRTICSKALGQQEKISAIGLGTVKIGRNQQVKYPNQFEIPDDQVVMKLLGMAQDLGINLIDTAPAYGVSEQRLGKLLPGSRHDWHIMTKAGEEFEQGESSFNFTPEHIELSIKRSLKRLNTDYLDTVLIHSDGNDIQLVQKYGVLEVLNFFKKKGLLRFSGISSKTVEGGLLALEQSDILMLTYNLEDDSQLPVIQKADELGKAIFIKKFFASGHQCLPGQMRELFAKIFSYSSVASVVVGTINVDHLRQNVSLLAPR